MRKGLLSVDGAALTKMKKNSSARVQRVWGEGAALLNSPLQVFDALTLSDVSTS